MKSYTRKIMVLAIAAAFSATAFAGDQTPTKPRWTSPPPAPYPISIVDSATGGVTKSIVAIQKGVTKSEMLSAFDTISPAVTPGTMCGSIRIDSNGNTTFEVPCAGQPLRKWVAVQSYVPASVQTAKAIYQSTRNFDGYLCPTGPHQTCRLYTVTTGSGKNRTEEIWTEISISAYYQDTGSYFAPNCPSGYTYSIYATDNDQSNAGNMYSCIKS